MIRLKMRGGRHRVVHIGGSALDAQMVREALSGSKNELYDVDWIGKLSDGLEQLATSPVSAVLLDLRLPDSPGIGGLSAGHQGRR